MKKIMLMSLGLIIAGSACQSKAAITMEQGAAAYDLLLSIPDILIHDFPANQTKLEQRQQNLNTLFNMTKEYKNAKKTPVKAISVTSYLALGEIRALIENVGGIIDILQNKIILKVGTVIKNDKIGIPLTKVKKVITDAVSFLANFIAGQALVLNVMKASDAVKAQKAQLQGPLGVDSVPGLKIVIQ